MQSPFRRALACALSASIILSPLSAAFAQKKGKEPPKSEAKASAKNGKKKEPTKADRARAKEAFARGKEKFEQGDFLAAAEAYREANSIIPAPQALFRIALSLDKAGKGVEAIQAYQIFLDAPPPDSMAEQKAEAENRLKSLQVGTLKLILTPPDATVLVDGQPAQGSSPLSLTLKPGAHNLQISAPNHEPTTRDLTVAAASSTELTIELKELPPPPPPPVPEPPPVVSTPEPAPAPPPQQEVKTSKVPAYVTLGLAGAGAVVGTIFGFKALSSKNNFDDKPSVKSADDAERNALISDMAFGVAITLGITGTVLLLSGDKKSEPVRAGKFRFAPILTPQAQGAAAILRF
jgi:hypothetical protein